MSPSARASRVAKLIAGTARDRTSTPRARRGVGDTGALDAFLATCAARGPCDPAQDRVRVHSSKMQPALGDWSGFLPSAWRSRAHRAAHRDRDRERDRRTASGTPARSPICSRGSSSARALDRELRRLYAAARGSSSRSGGRGAHPQRSVRTRRPPHLALRAIEDIDPISIWLACSQARAHGAPLGDAGATHTQPVEVQSHQSPANQPRQTSPDAASTPTRPVQSPPAQSKPIQVQSSPPLPAQHARPSGPTVRTPPVQSTPARSELSGRNQPSPIRRNIYGAT